MFSYHHHIGDFRRDTASLSDTDAMAYLKLLWMYYDTELPLPSDAKLLAFKIGSNAESVQLILDAFFTLDGNVYRQKRCDAEIFAYYARSDKARDKANKRWKNAAASEINAVALDGHIYSIAAEPEIDANREPRTEKKIKNNELIEIPDWVDVADWNDFLAMRRAIKKPMTPRAIKMMFSKLEQMKKKGIDISQVLQRSILNNWSDIYEPKVQTTQTNMERRVI
jgi:uncharacterized protein YdaU (DUF1376 family)